MTKQDRLARRRQTGQEATILYHRQTGEIITHTILNTVLAGASEKSKCILTGSIGFCFYESTKAKTVNH